MLLQVEKALAAHQDKEEERTARLQKLTGRKAEGVSTTSSDAESR